MDKNKSLKGLRDKLKASHDPKRASGEKKYLKSSQDFFGVTIPAQRKMARELARANPDATRHEVMGLCGALWARPSHQEKTLGIMLLEHYPQYLDMEAIPFIEGVLTDSMDWDHADRASIFLMGSVLEGNPKALRHLTRWSASWGLWLRRASMTAQIPQFREGKGDRRVFFSIARGMLGEKEFFIRKAIGWCVREISKADPIAAFKFLMEIRESASGLTLREGAKRLPEKMKKDVMKNKVTKKKAEKKN